ncbi:LAGLIDADG family homing endonuclease [Deinococcus murrayi]|uniref:LAGLIDADG family homing endonuclease n=1 Tax=Deinococcus murrayi TaxID=68910 RepID=UPI000A043E6A|nr:LAGLIDADG family homing endonuclease [Deinococcus murrayi]
MTTTPDPALRHFDDNAQHIARRQYLQPGDGDIAGMFRRVATWVAGAEAEEARAHWAQKYYDLMAEKKFCPGGRVLAGAGTQHGNVLNCLQGDTLVETRDGQRRIADLQGPAEVLSQGGVYRTAVFRSYGYQELYRVLFENGETVEATAGHEWPVGKRGGSGRYRKVTTLDLLGHFVPVLATGRRPVRDDDFEAGVRHGITYGDGSKNTNGHTHHVQLFGAKRQLARHFGGFRIHDAVYAGREVTVAQGMRGDLKALPDELSSDAYWYGFFCGLLATDGGVDDRGSVAIYQSDADELAQLSRQLVRFGVKAASLRLFRQADGGYGGKPSYALRLLKQTLRPEDFLREDQRERFVRSLRGQTLPRNASLRVVGIEPTGRTEEVFCCEEPQTHTFVIQGGLLTGNCFVQGATEHAPDGFDGVMEVAKKLALVTKVGGGNGVNLDVYAPRSAGSRPDAGVRGWAYMAASHPDVTDFVEGLMRPPTQPDGDKAPVAVRNWTRVVYGEAVPTDLVALARQNGVQIVRALPEGVQVVPDDMGGIIDAARAVAETARVGVEPRIDLSAMRPEGAPIKGSGGTSSGPVSFLLEIFDNFLEWANRGAETSGPVNTLRFVYSPVLRVVRQGGTRRGAGMATIATEHPDVLDFLTAKDLDREAAEGDISTFNISILVSEKFWQALERDALWHVDVQEVPGKYYLAPQDGLYDGRLPALPDRAEDGARGVPLYRTAPQGRYNPADGRPGVPAKWLWDQIAEHAWATGEPGLIFVDRVNEHSALKNLGKRYEIRSTNPCVTGDTWVSTAMGARQVRDLIGKDFCATVNGEFFDARGGFWLTGVKPVLKLRTRRGYELRLTDNHQLLKVTRQTRDVQETQWVETGTLVPGDRIMLSDHRGVKGWAGRGNRTEGWLLGSLVGDGTFITDKARPMAALGFWGEERHALADIAQEALSRFGTVKKLWRSNDEARERVRLSSEALAELAARYGIVHGRKTLTDEVEQGSYEFYRGFLQGLFDADGSVQGNHKNGVSVRLAQSDLTLLQRTQRMLARLGILSTLAPNRRVAGSRPMPDGAGGQREYVHKAQHELILSGSNLALYSELIGFRHPAKAERLARHLAAYQRPAKRERFNDEIVSITPDGEEAVYDVTVAQVHAFDANCILAHNCGEIPLTVGEPCDLGAINLAAYVKGSAFDYATFREDVRTCVRFLDDVLDVNVFALEDNRVASQELRRLGLGVMGLADALIKLGLRYDSEAGRQAIHDIMTALREEAVAESERLGKERGHYPVYTRSPRKIPHPARRNVAVLTVAPTGTTSMLLGVSSGIEPVFSPFIWRKIGSEYRALLHPLFMELLSQYPPAANMDDGQGGWNWDRVTEAVSENHGSVVGLAFIPDALQQVFVCAHDISPVDHVRMQGTVQRAFDEGGQHAANSLSKTINLPNSATVADVRAAYAEAYQTGCKGITVYRDGSRQFQVLSTSKKKEKKVQETAPAEAAAEVMGESVQPDPVAAPPEAAPVPAPAATPRPAAAAPAPVYERPTRLSGITDMVKLTDPTSGHRRSFLVTVNHLNGKPVEVMVISGRAGDEANADSEALGRVVSIALQHGVPAQAIIKTLRGINGGLYGSYNGRLVGSKADLIAVALDTFQQDLDAASLPPLAGGSVDAPAAPAAPSGVSVEGLARERCPVCEERAVIREEGCLKCQACGYSKCG